MTKSRQHTARKREDDDDKPTGYRVAVAVIVFLWILLGAMAYVSAFNCTHERYTGGSARKIGMLILAGVLGPFYWIIQPLVKADGYCQLKAQ